MPIPGQTFTILDPGLSLAEASPTTPLFLGTSELGTANALVSVANAQAAVDAFGQGPLTEAICHALAVAGGPVLGMKLATTVAATIGAVTVSRVGTSTGDITTTPPAGSPLDAYEVIVEITSDGSVASADFNFKYSLDDGRTFSGEQVCPAGGAFTIPSSGLTITFTDGAGPDFFEKGDIHSFDTVAPYYTTVELAAAVAVLDADPTEWAFLTLVGKPASAADGATMFAALDTHLDTFEASFRFVRGIMDAGNDTTANVITAFAAVESRRIMVVYGDADMTSSKPFAGYGTPKLSALVPVAGRAAASLISTDLGRVASGRLSGLVEISHDENFDEVLDQHKIATLRTHLGRSGFYVTRGRLKSPTGSDFSDWQLGRIMDVACRDVFIGQQNFLNIGVRTTGAGAIDERDARRLETQIDSRLRANLTQPTNAEGTPGQVSAVRYTIDRTNNILSSSQLISEVAIQPLGYARFISTTIGFALIPEGV
jgi:hypothetical protein